MKNVAVLITHTARLKCTKKCVSHLKKTVGVNVKLYIYVNGPQNEDTISYLNGLEKEGIVYSKEINECWTTRLYLLDRVSKVDYVLFLDNDIYVPPNWFIEMEKSLLRSPENVVAVGMILNYGSDRLFGGFSFGVDNGTLKYDSIAPPYDEDLICDACLEGAMMIRFSDKKYIDADGSIAPFSGYDLLLNVQKHNKKFIICKKVISEHIDYPTKEYTIMRYKKRSTETYKRFCDKWGIKVGKAILFKIRVATMYPKIWSVIKYSLQNIYKVLRYSLVALAIATTIVNFTPENIGTLALAYIMVSKIPLLMIPFMAPAMTIFAIEIWKYPKYLSTWIPLYINEIYSGTRVWWDIFQTLPFIYLYAAILTFSLLRIKWNTKKITVTTILPWILRYSLNTQIVSTQFCKIVIIIWVVYLVYESKWGGKRGAIVWE